MKEMDYTGQLDMVIVLVWFGCFLATVFIDWLIFLLPLSTSFVFLVSIPLDVGHALGNVVWLLMDLM